MMIILLVKFSSLTNELLFLVVLVRRSILVMKRKERLVRAGAFTVFAIEEVLALLRLLLAGVDVDGCTFQTQALYLGSVVHVHYRILEVVNYSRKVKLGSLIDVLDQFLCLLLFQISFVVLMDHCDFGHVNIFL